MEWDDCIQEIREALANIRKMCQKVRIDIRQYTVKLNRTVYCNNITIFLRVFPDVSLER